MSAVVVTIAVLLGAFAWRVAQGPISLGFLSPYVSEALALPEFGFRVEVADVVLAWSERDQSLRLRLVDAQYRVDAERVVLRVPSIDMGLSGPSLLRGVIAPRYVLASGVEARLVRDAQGRFQLGLPETAPADGAATGDTPVVPAEMHADDQAVQAMFGAIFDLLSRPPSHDDPLGQLQTVSILADRLVIEDWKLNQRWVVPQAQIGFHRGEGHVFASANGALDWRGRRVDLNVDADYTVAERTARVTLNFSNVEPSDFADVVPELAPLDYIAAPLAGSLTLTVSDTGTQLGLNFDLRAGEGQINAPDLLPQPLALQEARFRGYADGSKGILFLDEASLSFADRFRASFGGTLTRQEGERYGLDINGQFFDMATNALGQYWPPGMAKNARDWVTGHLSQGKVGAGRFAAKLTPEMVDGSKRLPSDAIKLDFAFEGLTLDYLAPMSRMTDGKGIASLDADVFTLNLESGRVGNIASGPGNVKITGLQDRDQFAEISNVARGSSADILGLIDQKPLGFPSKLGIKPASVGGQGEVKFRLRFPLLVNLRVDDIAVNAEADLTDLTMGGLLGRYALSEGQMKLKVDTKGLEASGRAALNGVPLQIGWREEFSAKAPVTARYTLKGRIDEAQRKALGYPLAPWIDGPAEANMEIEERRGGETAIGGEFDLRDATIAVADAHLLKPAGMAATGRTQIRTKTGQPVQFDLIEIASEALSGRARAVLNADNSWTADIAALKAGRSDAQGRISFAANGDAQVALTGHRYDLRPFVATIFEDDTPPGTKKPRLALDLRFDEAQLDDVVELRNMALSVRREPTRLEKVSLTGGFSTTGGLTLEIAPGLNGRDLKLLSDNAGAVLHFLGVTDMQGGTMTVNARYDDTQASQPLAGRMVLKTVRAVRAPFLARLLGIGSFTGLAALLSGEGIMFENGEVPFSQKDGVLTLQPSRLSGPQLGITFEGHINQKADTVSVSGTAVPAFVLNTMLGKIPLIGNLLVGDGIIGVNFAVSGAKDDPQFTVNPLSAIAPGFLRRIFQAPEVSTPSTGGAPPVLPPTGGETTSGQQ
ncbi:MAG: AsmA-like C-terminal domain-containing protein [Ferrovibrio sp.]|uniref:YhdP family protein n=1 Tax=Ferrovibrio sp. TaxID=1917215 RepID=UPI002601BF92|nr:AsmA-like C-terminal domain-containing protein [Ferrovibrio sp.]MCW0235726.1 AsmA-like C-terminal domain-containing protein [Ferrovibrio sp.]